MVFNVCWTRRWCVAVIVLTAAVVCALVAVLVLQPWASDYPSYPSAAVAANGFECAAIGREILEKNGSAVDAAIAVLFCDGIGCAQCMGLGGGFLATMYDAQSGRVRVLNARERAPGSAYAEMFNNASSTVGGLAVAIPGELRGYGAMHKEFGRLPWSELVKPTAELCRQGHRVNKYMARVLRTYSDVIKSEPSLSEIYVNPKTGDVYVEGDLLKEPALARTLDVIAEEGPEAMHNGSLTALLARDIQGFGGIITEDDLRNYQIEWQDPILVNLTEDHVLYSNPLPGSGGVLAFILNMLHGWVGDSTDVPFNSELYWHRVVETFKYAYAKRTGLGDPNRTDLNYSISDLENNMANAAWARSFRSQVNDSYTNNDWRHYGAEFGGADDHGTAHVTVVAPDGSVVSVTSTINYIWGAQRRSRSLGIMLNNEMDDFAVPNRANAYGLPPSPANMVAPGLQPLSSMAPSIVFNRKTNQADLVVGAAGGTKITTQVALIVMNMILESANLPEVMQRPRLHHQLVPMEVEYEADFNAAIIESLAEKGHDLSEQAEGSAFAAVVAISRDRETGMLIPNIDDRRGGSTDGF